MESMLAKNNVEQLNDYVVDYVEDFFIQIESNRSYCHTFFRDGYFKRI